MDNQQVRIVFYKPTIYSDKYLIGDNGNLYSVRSKKILKHTEVSGYKRYSFVANGKDIQRFAHTLVAQSFLGTPDGLEVNHIDGNKQNNNVWNLEWVTRSDNLKHAFNLGLKDSKGEANARALLTEQDVVLIYKKMLYGESESVIAKEFCVNKSTVRNIKIKKNWGYLLEDLEEIPTRKNRKALTEQQKEDCIRLRSEGFSCKQMSELLGISLHQAEGVFRNR